MSFSQTIVVGVISKNAEIRYFPNGEDGVASFSIPVSKKYNDKSGNSVERTKWYNCKVFGKKNRLEFIEKNLVKGQPVMVTGELEDEEWTDKSNVKQVSTILRVDEFQLTGSPFQRSGNTSTQQSREEAPVGF